MGAFLEPNRHVMILSVALALARLVYRDMVSSRWYGVQDYFAAAFCFLCVCEFSTHDVIGLNSSRPSITQSTYEFDVRATASLAWSARNSVLLGWVLGLGWLGKRWESDALQADLVRPG